MSTVAPTVGNSVLRARREPYVRDEEKRRVGDGVGSEVCTTDRTRSYHTGRSLWDRPSCVFGVFDDGSSETEGRLLLLVTGRCLDSGDQSWVGRGLVEGVVGR